MSDFMLSQMDDADRAGLDYSLEADRVPHTSTCTDPRSGEYEYGKVVLWASVVGKMYQIVYACVNCGETAQVERFEAAEVAEED